MLCHTIVPSLVVVVVVIVPPPPLEWCRWGGAFELGRAQVQMIPSWQAVMRQSSRKTSAVSLSCAIFLQTSGSNLGTSSRRGQAPVPINRRRSGPLLEVAEEAVLEDVGGALWFELRPVKLKFFLLDPSWPLVFMVPARRSAKVRLLASLWVKDVPIAWWLLLVGGVVEVVLLPDAAAPCWSSCWVCCEFNLRLEGGEPGPETIEVRLRQP